MKKLLFIFLSIFLSVTSVLSLIIIKPASFTRAQTDDYKSYLQLWHIDGFAGGVGSRASLLKKLAEEYAKKSNVVITVTLHTAYSAEQNFKKGIFPDIFSYSNGVNLPYSRLNALPFKEQIGSYGERCYAVVWCMGGYVYVARKGQKISGVIISDQQNTLPMLAYELSNVKIPIKTVEKSTNALSCFYADEKLALIGTQRDLHRLSGKGYDLEVVPLCGFNDLYQYLSVLADGNNYYSALSFIKWILQKEQSENELEKIGMLAYGKQSEKNSSSLLKIIYNTQYDYVLQPFLSYEKLQNIKSLSNNYSENAQSIKSVLKQLK